MADVFSRAKRSEVMSRIRSRGNRDTELALARVLRANGIKGWRRHTEVRGPKSEVRSSRVRPDFVFPKRRVTVFVDGCFWHGCPKHSPPKKWLRKSSMPSKPVSSMVQRTGRAFWRAKLAANQARDRKINRTLRRAGWRVVRIWEHELQQRGARNAERGMNGLVRRMQRALRPV